MLRITRIVVLAFLAFCFTQVSFAQTYSEELVSNAQSGDMVAQRNLGICYYFGEGVDKNSSEALKWFLKASKLDADAQYYLGEFYYYGRGGTKDYKEAVKWWIKAAEQGNATAQYNLGVCYYNGEGVAQNYAEAVKWWTKAANKGNINAQHNLADCYAEGRGVKKDDTKAADYYTRSATNFKRNKDKPDLEAIEWLKNAAQKGNPEAQYGIGQCYYWGNGVPRDEDKATEWYFKAAENGHIIAQFETAVNYYYSDENNGPKKAKEYVEKVLEQGNPAFFSYLGADLHFIGSFGGYANIQEATDLYMYAADKGNASALYNLGCLYYDGFIDDGIDNYKMAFDLWTMAAEQEDLELEAEFKLAECYYKGEGVAQDYAKAANYFQKYIYNSSRAVFDAMLYLSKCYANGRGVEQDMEKAKYWMSRSAEKGSDDAKKTIELQLNMQNK